MKHRSSSLRTRLSLALALSVTAAIAAIGYFAYLSSAKVVESEMISNADAQVQRLSAYVSSNLDSVKVGLSILALDPQVDSLDWAKAKLPIARAKAALQQLDALYLVDAKGSVLDGSASDQSGADYFRGVLQDMAEFYVSGPSADPSGAMHVVLAVPLRRGAEIVGILCGRTTMDLVAGNVSMNKIGKTGFAFMLGADGLVISHPEAEVSFRENFAESPDPALSSIGKRMIASEEGSGSYTLKGAARVCYFGSVSGTPWSIAVSYGREEFIAPLRTLAFVIAAAGLVIAACIAVLVAILVSRSLRPLVSLQAAFESLARGDLRERVAVRSGDEVGALALSYDGVIDRLSELIAAVKAANAASAQTGQSLAASAEETSAAIEELEASMTAMGERSNELSSAISSSGAAIAGIGGGVEGLNTLIERQSSALSQSSAFVEEMLASVASLERGAEKRLDESRGSAALASRGDEATRDMAAALERVNAAAESMLDMITVIDQVAGQTNILAMNAAIEAAHAGEAGRGFSVVADEIRKLAESTAGNAREISATLGSVVEGIGEATQRSRAASELFGGIMRGANAVERGMEESLIGLKDLDAGSSQITRALDELRETSSLVRGSGAQIGARLREIDAAISDTSRIASEDSSAIRESARGLGQISASIAALSSLSYRNAEAVSGIEERLEGFALREEEEGRSPT